MSIFERFKKENHWEIIKPVPPLAPDEQIKKGQKSLSEIIANPKLSVVIELLKGYLEDFGIDTPLSKDLFSLVYVGHVKGVKVELDVYQLKAGLWVRHFRFVVES